MTTSKFNEIFSKVNEKIQSVREGAASQYFKFEDENEETYTIRVSNHNANPSRVDANTLIFVVDGLEKELEREDDDCTSMTINKKKFRSIANQHIIDENNYDECGNDVEYILESFLN